MSKQTVYNILASKPVKVELALVDELKTRIAESKQAIASVKQSEKALLDLFDAAAKFASDLQSEYGVSMSLNNVIDRSIERIQVAAKELGVDFNSINEVKQLQSIQQELLKSLSSADGTLKAYRSL
jgi:predicted YcjX-like family ATPase